MTQLERPRYIYLGTGLAEIGDEEKRLIRVLSEYGISLEDIIELSYQQYLENSSGSPDLIWNFCPTEKESVAEEAYREALESMGIYDSDHKYESFIRNSEELGNSLVEVISNINLNYGNDFYYASQFERVIKVERVEEDYTCMTCHQKAMPL